MENISLSRISHRAQNNRADSKRFIICEFGRLNLKKIERSIVTSALDDNSYLKIPNEYCSESGGGISTKSEVFSRKNGVNSDKVLRLDCNTADHLVNERKIIFTEKSIVIGRYVDTNKEGERGNCLPRTKDQFIRCDRKSGDRL